MISPTAIALLVIVGILLVTVIPRWPYSRSWGYAPTSTLGIVFGVVLVFVFMGVL